MRVEIGYVDGEEVRCDAADWRNVRAEGVDTVAVGVEQMTTFQGHSVYWLRRDGSDWLVGAASFYPNPISEIRIASTGEMTETPLEWVPDLHRDDVKLGWWHG